MGKSARAGFLRICGMKIDFRTSVQKSIEISIRVWYNEKSLPHHFRCRAECRQKGVVVCCVPAFLRLACIHGWWKRHCMIWRFPACLMWKFSSTFFERSIKALTALHVALVALVCAAALWIPWHACCIGST
jgi:hypothetical protein